MRSGEREKKSGDAKKWDETSFFVDLSERIDEVEVAVYHQILEWIRTQASDIWWARGIRTGSYVPIFMHNE